MAERPARFCRWRISRRGLWPDTVAVAAPEGQLSTGIGLAVEDLFVQAFVAQAGRPGQGSAAAQRRSPAGRAENTLPRRARRDRPRLRAGPARGRFIAFLDSDNRWYPWTLDTARQALRRHPDAALVFPQSETQHDDPPAGPDADPRCRALLAASALHAGRMALAAGRPLASYRVLLCHAGFVVRAGHWRLLLRILLTPVVAPFRGGR